MYLTKVSLLSTFGKLIQRYNKNYVYPSQDTLLRLLKQHYHIIINRRSLNYHLADLRAQGLIKSIKRNARNAQGQFEQLTSATCLTVKGCRLLFKLGSAWALRHLKKLRIKFGFKVEAHSKTPSSPYQNPRGKLPKEHTLPDGRKVKRTEPGKERPWKGPIKSLLTMMQSDEYLEKYPKMKNFVKARTREAEKKNNK